MHVARLDSARSSGGPYQHPGRREVAEREAAVREQVGLDPEVEPSTLTYLLTSLLVVDVVDAAGAVEYSIGQLDSSMERAQAYADENIVPTLDLENWPEFGQHMATPDVQDARWAFANAVSGTRTLLERIDRRDVTKRRRPQKREGCGGISRSCCHSGGREMLLKGSACSPSWQTRTRSKTRYERW
jgi:hypothetical protein